MGVLWPLLTARSWLAALLSLDLLVVSVSTIKCLQCTTLHNRDCASGGVAAMDCQGKNDRYCIKLTGDTDGFVLRACSQEVHKSECERQVHAGVVMKVCAFTCYTDGCNTAAMTGTSLPLALLLAIALVLCPLVFSQLTT